MAGPEQAPLTEDERAELEALRAERAARAQAAERAELERLRAQARHEREERERDEHDARLRERNRRLMEPDDDLAMPPAQRVVLGALAFIVVAFVVYLATGM